MSSAAPRLVFSHKLKPTRHVALFRRKAALSWAIASLASLGALASAASATTISWSGGNSATDLNWSDALNWNPSAAAPVNDLYTDVAHFGLADYTGHQPNIDATRSVHGILIDGAGALAFTGTGTLDLGSGGLTISSGAGPVNFTASGGLRVDQVQTWTNASTNNLTLNTITRATGGVTLNLVNTGGGQVLTTSTNDATGLLNGPWMNYTDTTGSYYATASGGAVAAYTGGVALTDVNSIGLATQGSENDDIAGATLTNTTLTGPVVANTVRYIGAAQTIQLGDAAHSNVTLQINGLMSAGTGTLTIADGTPDHTGGVLVTGETVLTAAGADLELTAALVSNSNTAKSISVAGTHHVLLNNVVNNGTGPLTFNGFGGVYYVGSTGKLILNAASGNISWATNLGASGLDNPVIADNPTTPGSIVEISGTKTVTLSGNNTYTGGTIIDAGATLSVGARYYGTGTQNLGSGPITINAGATITTVADNEPMWITGVSGMIWNGSWTMANAGFNLAATTDGAGPYGTVLLNAPNIVFTQNGNQGVTVGAVSDGGNNYGFTVINTVAGASSLNFSGGNSFTGALQIGDGTTPGAVTFSGSNPTWAGNIVLNAGSKMDLEKNDALGTSTVTINGGTVATYTGYTNIAISTAVTYEVNGDFSAYGSTGRTLDLGSTSTIHLNAPITLTLTNNGPTVALHNVAGGSANGMTVIYGSGVTSGTLSMAGGNTFTGLLSVGNGTAKGAVALSGDNTGWLGNILVTPTGTLSISNTGLGLSTVTFQDGATLTDGGSTAVAQAANLYMGGKLNAYAYNGTMNLNAALVTLTSPLTVSFYASNRSSAVQFNNLSDAGHSYGLTVQLADPSETGNVNLGGNVTITGPFTVMGGTSIQLVSGNHYHRDVPVFIDVGGTFTSDYTSSSTLIAGINDGPTGPGTVGAGSNGLALKLTGSGNYAFSGVIGGTKNSVLMAGTGTQALSGANTYTLGTSTYSGTLNLDFSGPSAAGSLDDHIDPAYAGYQSDILYHNAAASTGIVNPGITVSGGTLLLTGKSAASDLQRFGHVSLGTGASTIKLDANGATSLVLSTGNIAAATANGTLHFDLQSSGAQSATNGVLTTTQNTNGIMGGNILATLPSGAIEFAVSGASEVPAGTVVGTDPGTWSNAGDGTVLFVGNLANGTAVSFNTISAGSGITAGQLYYVVNSAGGQFKVAATPGATASPTGATSGASGTNTIDTQGNISALATHSTLIGDSSDHATDNALVSADLTLAANTTVNTLKIDNSAIGTLDLGGKNLYLAGGALLFTGSADYTISNGLLHDYQSINHLIIETYGTGNLTISAAVYGQYGGNGYGASLVKTGPGTLTLTGTNGFGHSDRSYEALFIEEGILNINGDAVLGYAGSVTFNGGTLQYQSPDVGALVDSGDITANPLAATAPVIILPGGATVDTNGNDIVWAHNFGGGDVTALVSGVPTGGFTKTGAGTLTLQGLGQYAGATTVSGGTLSIATLTNGGVTSSIGQSTNAAPNLVLDGGTLQYTGAAVSTDRNFTLNASGGGLDASGTGALIFSNTSAIAVAGPGSRTLTLSGTSTELNTLNLQVIDGATSSDATALAKTGVGTWAVTNANTYTGGTNVSAGILLASNTTGSATGAGNVTMNGGTLGGSGIISGNVLAGAAAHTILPSATLTGTSTAKLTMAGLTTSTNTTLAFKLVSRGSYDTHGVNTVASVNDSLNITAPTALTLGGGTLSIVNDPANVGLGSLGFYKAIQYSGTFTGSYNSTSIHIPAVNQTDKITYTLDIAQDPGFIDIHRGFQGDANDDGTVTFADFVKLSNNFGLPDRGWLGGDFNGDGVTSFADFVILSNNFGLTVGGGSLLSSDEIASFHAETANFGATSVPEPTSLALLGLGAVALLKRKRKA